MDKFKIFENYDKKNENYQNEQLKKMLILQRIKNLNRMFKYFALKIYYEKKILSI